MYYVLNLKDLTKDNVFSYIKYEQVRNRRKEIDQDVSFELADYNSIIFSDKNLSIKYRAFNPIKKTFYNSKQYYEYSMLANLWHYINRQI